MSMLVIGVTAYAVLMAADSRQYPNGKETVQKVFLVGKRAMVGHSGIGVIPFDSARPGAWDASDVVESISKRVPDILGRAQFDFIRSELLESINAGLARCSLEIGGSNPHVAIMFAHRDADGQVFIAREEIKVVSTSLADKRWRNHAEASAPQILTNAKHADRGIWWDVPPGCPVGQRMPAAPTNAAISAFINDVAVQSPVCSQKIGGPVRVAIVDDAVARWLQR
jgi:hypothetical protein